MRRSFGRWQRGVALLSLLGAATAAGVAVPASADATPLNSEYVALGDSFAAGPLILPQVALDPCFRSGKDYAHLVAAALHVRKFTDVTCSSATTDNMTSPQAASLPWDPAAPPQFDALTANTTLVTVTIGANDAGLVGLAEGCLNLLPEPLGTSCEATDTAGGVDKGAAAVDGAIPKVAATLDAIHQRSPQAKVIITSYGDYAPPGGCYPIQPIWSQDSDYVQGLVDRIGTETRALTASRPWAGYVDFIGPGANHTACDPLNNWVTGFVPVDGIVPLHPTAQGEAAFASLVLAALGGSSD
ncbi:MAG TPA: SGNH/GDSL hydrolase family protein [Pseudonocardiaceae bacterium]|nr:SGNH/GDSL hydrolase family protein [Pseudonocardiaceae bacterium]